MYGSRGLCPRHSVFGVLEPQKRGALVPVSDFLRRRGRAGAKASARARWRKTDESTLIGSGRRGLAGGTALVLLAGTLGVAPALTVATAAEATFATGGQGRFVSQVDWFDWKSNWRDLGEGATETNVRMINGQPLETTCTLSNVNGPITSYRPGQYAGDGLDDLYNVGGTDRDNQLFIGITNKINDSTVSFDVTCSLTYGGVPVPIGGLVVADAEASGSVAPRDEWIRAQPLNGAPTWRIIDRYRKGCSTNTLAEIGSSNGLTFVNDDLACSTPQKAGANGSGPMAVAFAEGATSLNIRMKGAAKSAVALGVMLYSDFGDAPQSYGDAGAFYEPVWQGGTVGGAGSSTPVSANAFQLADIAPPSLRLGNTITSEPSPLYSNNADADQGDDGVVPPSSFDATPGENYTLGNIKCSGTGFISGWIDWNGNGEFDAGEKSDTVACPVGSDAELSWTVPADAKTGASFMRLRIAADASEIASPTGMSMTGEVEDYAIDVLLPELDIEKSSTATEDSRVGDTVTYTVTATNVGQSDFTDDYPGYFFDDLTGVLDDADLDESSIELSPNVGTAVFDATSKRIAWSGPLPAGESVELSYTVTLKSGGDRKVDNVAFVAYPDDPDPTTPECIADSPSPVACTFAELPALEVTKVASQTSLPSVGESVTYTITVKNAGPGEYTETAPATMTDDLSDVLDDATLDGGVAATSGTANVTGTTLSWSGALASGATASITYTVTYTGAGDQRLNNVACVPESESPAGVDNCATVNIPGANLAVSKESSPSATPLIAGSTVLYTLWFENSGQAAGDVDHTDILTHVLDDADVTIEPAAGVGDLTATRTADRIRIIGSVPAGERYSVVYTVTVKADGERGDNLLVNHLLPGEPTIPPAAPDPEEPCVSTVTSTCNPVGNIRYEKSVSYDEPLGERSELTYTVTITNDGHATAPVAREDVLSDLLDDAEISVDPTSDTVSVTVSSVSNERFSIGGSLDAGATAKVTYRVKLKSYEERGNDRADNFIVPPGDEPPTACDADSALCTSTPLPRISPSKSVNPSSGTSVTAGKVLTYTLRFENTGKAPGAVDYTDVLSGILDDADIVVAPVSSDAALTPNLGSDETLHITGELDAGQVVTVSYQVEVKPDGQRGDNHLANFLMTTSEVPEGPIDPATCDAASKMCTENPISEIAAWKSVAADTEPVQAGTMLRYTLHFENIGTGSGNVSYVDDLTHVTDDADVSVEPVGTADLTANRNGNRILITGPLAAGATETVEYVVTVKPDDERGDDIAANFLLEVEDEDDLPTGPEDPVCQPADSERPDCTVTPIGKLLVSKSVSASETPVTAGTILTYTLTFDNQGTGSVAVDQTDILSDVLDDATVTTQPVASDAALSATQIVNESFRVTGTLMPGQTATVSYSVTVNPESERGNSTADNFLVPTGTEPPSECSADSMTCTQTPLPRVLAGKTADPVSTTTVVAGQEVEYTLTFTNTGKESGVIDYSDDLAGVLDDAELTAAPESSDPSVQATSGADGTVRITGPVPAGATVTVRYKVTVKADGERGDNLLRNAISKTGTTECDAIEGQSCSTEHPVSELIVLKAANPAHGTPLVVGQEVEYTLTFTNVGKGTATITKVDDLTHVLDDATVISEPASSAAGVTAKRDGHLIAIAGRLSAGESAKVSYTVKVKAESERGDSLMANFVLNPDDATPEKPECEPEAQICTFHPVGQVSAVKSVDPASGTTVSEDNTLTYTLSFENTGTGTAPVAYTDYLAGILDDADITGAIVASDGLSAVQEGDTILVGGSLPAGGKGSVSYRVTVKKYTEQGDHHLVNFLTPDGIEPPSECIAENPMCTQNPIKKPTPGLAVTGGQGAEGLALAGFLALCFGGALLFIRRRRENTLG